METWDAIQKGTLQLHKQNDAEATLWPGRKPGDGEIRSSMTMNEADALVRAVTRPYPGAFYVSNSERIVIWSAKTSKTDGPIPLSDGFLVPLEYEVEDLQW